VYPGDHYGHWLGREWKADREIDGGGGGCSNQAH
jgi:hypothetical protein